MSFQERFTTTKFQKSYQLFVVIAKNKFNDNYIITFWLLQCSEKHDMTFLGNFKWEAFFGAILNIDSYEKRMILEIKPQLQVNFPTISFEERFRTTPRNSRKITDFFCVC